jgi:glycosyltransferase involved in cell wall biosynthesis
VSEASQADRPGVVVVIPARNEEQRIQATVSAALSLPSVHAVFVVDDGSDDQTSRVATAGGATVIRHRRNRGKAAAMTTGAAAAAAAGQAREPLLFLDADLADSAANAGPLIDVVLGGAADMAIAAIPRTGPPAGRGLVVRLSARGIERRTGWRATQPLSGQRCITRSLFDRLLPLARGFGVETGLTIDALIAGARVVECPVDLRHRETGTSVRDQLHRARQYRDVWLALVRRRPLRRPSR